MIEKMVERTEKYQRENDCHITWAAYKISEEMTDNEIVEFANEVGSRRFMGYAHRATTGFHNRTGKELTAKDVKRQKGTISSMIADQIAVVIRIREDGR